MWTQNYWAADAWAADYWNKAGTGLGDDGGGGTRRLLLLTGVGSFLIAMVLTDQVLVIFGG